MRKSTIFSYFLLSFIAGIGIASFVIFDFFVIYSFFLIFSIITLFLWQNTYWRVIFIGGLLIAVGIFYYQINLPITSPDKIWFYNGQKVFLTGKIINEPDQRIANTKLTVTVSQADNKLVSGKVLLTTALYPQYQYGDLISVDCRLEKPEVFDGFDYERYLAKDQIYSLCYSPKIKLVQAGRGNLIFTKIFAFKKRVQEVINTNLPEPQASLISAMILGNKRGIPEDVKEQFSVAGVSHLLAISGLHITLVMAILMKLSIELYLPRKKSFWLITLTLFLYIILIGLPPSAVRAFVMGWLMMLAMQVGRLNQSTNSLILAAAVMLVFNPKVLRDDIGFQLSFTATLGIIYFSPFFERLLEKLPSFLASRETLIMSLSAQVSTLPLIFFYFGRAALVGPLTNVLILPVLPYLMVSAFLSIFLVFVLTILNVNFFIGLISLSQVLFWPTYLLLTYIIEVAKFFAGLPLSAINI